MFKIRFWHLNTTKAVKNFFSDTKFIYRLFEKKLGYCLDKESFVIKSVTKPRLHIFDKNIVKNKTINFLYF